MFFLFIEPKQEKLPENEISINTLSPQMKVNFFSIIYTFSRNPAGTYLLKVNNRNTRTRYEICSKSTIKISERRHWRRSGIFIVYFKHISHLGLLFQLPAGKWLSCNTNLTGFFQRNYSLLKSDWFRATGSQSYIRK